MADNKTVTVANTTAGETVVINNKKDGLKKYSMFFGGVVLAALIQGVKAAFPKFGPIVDVVLDILSAAFPAIGAMFLTSPLDQRGVVINKNGSVTGDKIGIPNPPSAPIPPGTGLSLFIFCFFGLLFALTASGCSYEQARATARPQLQAATVRQPVPFTPVATMSKTVKKANVQTAGLKNPGAEPGEVFSTVSGGSCEQRLTVDGWVTVCNQPNDGDSFDDRNTAREAAKAEFPGLLGR